MNDLPSGADKFLFTNIEGSTRLAQGHPANWESRRKRHHATLRGVCEHESCAPDGIQMMTYYLRDLESLTIPA